MSWSPTPQAISALLKRAGFERSESHATRIRGYRRSTEGYQVRGDYRGGVEVGYFSRDCTDAEHAEMLAGYRTVIEAADWQVSYREGVGVPRLIVTARKDPGG